MPNPHTSTDGSSTVSTPSTSPPTSRSSTVPMCSFSEIKGFLSTELSAFKNDLKRQTDESINNAVKKFRAEQPFLGHSFKSKGNEEQFCQEEKVSSHLNSAIQALERGKMLECRQVLEEGKALLATQIKKHCFSGSAWVGLCERV